VILLVLLAACDDTLFGVLPDTGSAAVEQPDYAADVQPIWDDACDGCHIGAAQGGLALDQGAAVLVGVPSTEAPDVLLVAPGDVEASYLWLKLTGEQAAGSAMPLGSALDEGDLGTVRNWIEEGAP
jgi:hypothetical protein